MYVGLKQALGEHVYRKVPGIREFAGIVFAFPFLADELVAFCATIPPELQLKDGRLRAFFKDAFRDFLPEEVTAKKKHGFGMPFYEWTRGHPPLRELAFARLESLRGGHPVRGACLARVQRQLERSEPTASDGTVCADRKSAVEGQEGTRGVDV